jgi:hypothetical protein
MYELPSSLTLPNPYIISIEYSKWTKYYGRFKFSIRTTENNHNIHCGIPPKTESCSIPSLTIWATFARKKVGLYQTHLAIDVGERDIW